MELEKGPPWTAALLNMSYIVRGLCSLSASLRRTHEKLRMTCAQLKAAPRHQLNSKLETWSADDFSCMHKDCLQAQLRLLDLLCFQKPAHQPVPAEPACVAYCPKRSQRVMDVYVSPS